MNEIALAKQQLRSEILLKRKEIANVFRDDFTLNLTELVTGLKPNRVAIYQSYLSEPNTEDFINRCPVQVIVPITNPDGNLTWKDLESETITEIKSGDLLIIPALAVDHRGNRLGRGKGYFDRTLASLPEAVSVFALIFNREFVQSIPTEPHDRKVDGVVTETGIHKIN